MKQEKKPTVWTDITDADNKLQPWQKNAWGKISGGLRKGQMYVVSAGRRTGKSHMASATLIDYYQQKIREEWREWEPVFIWPWDRKMSVSKKKIWGRAMQKRNNMIKFTLYATKKEVFERKLRGTD